MNKIYFVSFNHDAKKHVKKKIKSKNQAILEMFYVKELSNLISRESFGATTQETDR